MLWWCRGIWFANVAWKITTEKNFCHEVASYRKSEESLLRFLYCQGLGPIDDAKGNGLSTSQGKLFWREALIDHATKTPHLRCHKIIEFDALPLFSFHFLWGRLLVGWRRAKPMLVQFMDLLTSGEETWRLYDNFSLAVHLFTCEY
jgi:hypothetical protein